MKKQTGATMVEFAISALLFFTIIFGIIEFARAFFVYNSLIEATRRGARVAAICPPHDLKSSLAKIRNTVMFNPANSVSTSSPLLLGLTDSDITVNYLDDNFVSVSAPEVDDIAFVQVCIGTNSATRCDTPILNHTLIIPLLMNTFQMPVFSTTLPAESLGRQTNTNPLPVGARDCF